MAPSRTEDRGEMVPTPAPVGQTELPVSFTRSSPSSAHYRLPQAVDFRPDMKARFR